MLPGLDFTHEVGFELTQENWMLPGVCGASELEHELEEPSIFATGPVATTSLTPDAASSSAFSLIASGHVTPNTAMSDDEHSSDEDRRDPDVKLQNLRGASQWVSWSHHISIFLGKSLGTGVVKAALAMCKELAPDVAASDVLRFRSKVWDRPTVSTCVGYQRSSSSNLEVAR